MIRRIDNVGRIVLPKALRDRLGVSVGTPIDISVDEDKIILKKYFEFHNLQERIRALEEALDQIDSLEAEQKNLIRRHIKALKELCK